MGKAGARPIRLSSAARLSSATGDPIEETSISLAEWSSSSAGSTFPCAKSTGAARDLGTGGTADGMTAGSVSTKEDFGSNGCIIELWGDELPDDLRLGTVLLRLSSMADWWSLF